VSQSGDSRVRIDALVLDGHFRQALACIRSLSRSGAEVGAVACESEAGWAPALRSRWCRFAAAVPDFDDRPDRFLDEVTGVIDAHCVRVVIPSHDGSIQALRSRRAEIERRTFLPLASEAALDIAVSKTRTLALASQLGIAVPKSLLVSNEGDVRAAIREFACPVVIKPISSWGQSGGHGTRIGADIAVSLNEALKAMEKIGAAGLQGVIQQWLPGRRDAITVFRAKGRILARFAQTSYREFPPLGGNTVLCESIPLLADLVEPTDKLIHAADLDGCSMVEFRRDQQGRPVLMEVNARMPGSVGLAISAGVDFPNLLYRWAIEQPLEEVKAYRVGRRQRWLSGELWYLKCVVEGPRRPDTPSLPRAIGTFLYDFVRRPSALDGVMAGDLVPAMYELRHGVIQPVFGRAGKSARRLGKRTVERTNGFTQD
jgi:predicted ATP-grasp superfamily ATP-dependent carboligase